MSWMFWRKRGKGGGGKLTFEELGVSPSDPDWEAKARAAAAAKGHRNPDKVVARLKKRMEKRAGTPAP
jgi:hypothetical protein